ncbi:MAG: FGGY family carbohydrate kinase [Alphaproteobacteria bacterium]|nr:FGGY family carbohydrate kinase [Alphaproteobacteria bacterium]
MRDLYLAIDVGTGSIRAALVDLTGKIIAICHKEHEQIVPQHGWSEQRPQDWWDGTIASVQDVLKTVENAADRVACICSCGQMHGSVLIDDDGNLTRAEALLWNDKRTQPQVDAFTARAHSTDLLPITANMPATAWPAFKLLWLQKNDPVAVESASTLLMPKDWINYKLTGERAQDFTEGSLSYLMDSTTKTWSEQLIKLTGIPKQLLPEIKSPADVLGTLSQETASLLGLPEGIPVLVGAGDYPMALLGSGVSKPGLGSDVTGTSSIITFVHETPVINEEVSNLATVEGNWGSFTLLDAGGDAVRWARRAFHGNRRDYAEVADLATQAEPGSDGLFFLPYLSGERFGSHSNSRAQFFGLTATHDLPDLHRAVLEGVAFSVRQKLDSVEGGAGRPDRIVAASGGAKSELWLNIKASMYGVPYLVPEELECGVVGAAILMAVASGYKSDIDEATRGMVRYGQQFDPIPAWTELYDKMMPIYSDLYESSQQFYDRIDALPLARKP